MLPRVAAEEELLEERLFHKAFPDRPEVAVALLLVKYCLLGGSSAVVLSSTDTTGGEPEGWSPRGLEGVVNLAGLRSEIFARSSPPTAASTDVGSNSGSPWGSSRRGCFSTASVSAEGLEHPKRVGVSWACFFRLWLELLAQEEVLCPKVLHCLQNHGNDSYNTF